MITKKFYTVVFQIKKGGTLKYTEVVNAKDFSEAVRLAKIILREKLRNEFRIKSISED